MQIDPRNLASAVQSGEAGQQAARSMLEQQRLAIVSARETLALARSDARVRRQNLYTLDWGEYDVVYAYLSPAPMADVWRKVCAEMRPGSIFISNSFAVPGVEPDLVVETRDWHGSRLLIWYR